MPRKTPSIHQIALPFGPHSPDAAARPDGADFTMIDFFCGMGTVRAAFEPHGWRSVYAVDRDSTKGALYAARYGTDHLAIADVCSLTMADVPAADLWWASFPCTNLSLAGQQQGINGPESGAYWGVARLLRQAADHHVLPPLVMLENVQGLLSLHGGDDLALLLRSLADQGYHMDVLLVDAAPFTRQSRPRIVVVAAQPESGVLAPANDRTFAHPLRPAPVARFVHARGGLPWAHLPLPPLPDAPPALTSLMEDLPAAHANWWSVRDVERLLSLMTPRNRAYIDGLIAAPGRSWVSVSRRGRGGAMKSEPRRDDLAGCLRPPKGGSSTQIMLRCGDGLVFARRLLSIEAARLQGLPDIVDAGLPESAVLFALGDAVCVSAISWIAAIVTARLAVARSTPGHMAARQSTV